jgi:hypothetical protein
LLKNPLAEVFGYPIDNMSQNAVNHRQGGLCPYHNSSGLKCTKNSATDPLGVCTIFEGERLVVTCPIRLRQDFRIVADAVDFFFPGASYVPLTEVRLKDKNGKSAGNIDIVIAALNSDGDIVDFGAVEVQTVYISGNVTKAFRKYMENPVANYAMEWPRKNYPRPDYLSSSRKRLAPQLIYKGGILHNWGKKTAVVVHKGFYEQLPLLEEVEKSEAEIAWLIYDLQHDESSNRYDLVRSDVKYTKFESALTAITTPSIGEMVDFLKDLKARIKKGKTMGTPLAPGIAPEVEPLADLLETDIQEIFGEDEFTDDE